MTAKIIPMKRPTGRPKGYSPGLQRRITTRVGEWAWNTDRLNEKIQVQPGCHIWTGSTGPHTNLFGAYKNDKSQMTQARRIIYMDRTGEDIADSDIIMTCHNRYCCNFEHMTRVKTDRWE